MPVMMRRQCVRVGVVVSALLLPAVMQARAKD